MAPPHGRSQHRAEAAFTRTGAAFTRTEAVFARAVERFSRTVKRFHRAVKSFRRDFGAGRNTAKAIVKKQVAPNLTGFWVFTPPPKA